MECPRITIVRDDGKGDRNPKLEVDGSRWVLLNGGLEGFDGVRYTLSTQDYAQYDGAYLMSERSGTVDRTIDMLGFGDVAELRTEAERFFISGREYEVHVEAEGRARWFRARQYALSVATDSMRGGQLVTWTCLALDPMLMSEDEKRFDPVEAVGHRGFPFISLMRPGSAEDPRAIPGFVVGVRRKAIEMVNGGDATAYPVFEMRAYGDVVNPSVSISDSTGAEVARFALELTMHEGDVVVADFSARPTVIELNGQSVINLTTPDSTLSAGIDVGDFTLTWAADSGDAALSIKPTIRERYTTI